MNDQAKRARARHFAIAATSLLALAACGGRAALPPAHPVTPIAPASSNETATKEGSSKEKGPSIAEPAPSSRSVAVDAPPPDAFDDPDRARHVEALLPSLGSIVDAEIESAKVPSLAVALVVDGKAVLTKVSGFQDLAAHTPATAATIYRIGSITKTFTATALLRLRDEGKIDLDAPATRWLPELARVARLHADDGPVTLRALLTHTSGLPRLGAYDGARTDRDTTEAEVLAALDTQAAFDSGTRSGYSNLGFSILGLVVGRASGMAYRAYVEQNLLAPLQMSASGFDPAALPHERLAVAYARKSGKYEAVPYWRLGAAEGAGGLFASLDDMVRYASFELAAWPPRDDRDDGPVKRASLRESHETAFADGLDVQKGTGATRAASDGIGLAWQTRTTCDYEQLVWHNGAVDGETAALYLAPQRGFAIVLLSNASDAPLDALAGKLLDRIAASRALPPRQARPRKALTDLATNVVASLGTCNDALVEKTFTTSFRNAIPASVIATICRKMHMRHGACSLSGVERTTSANGATFKATCAQGRLLVDATLADEGGPRLSGLRLVSDGLPPSAALKSAADRVLALASHWDDKGAPAFVAPADRVKQDLAAAHARFGRCKLAPTDVSDGAERAVFPLVCDQGEGELTIAITEGTGGTAKIRSFEIHERPSTARCR